jgi:dTDP-4-amino-4,6-dideoxygalactose transaminase
MNVPYFVPWITKGDAKSVTSAMKNRWLTVGPNLKKFEKKFSKYIGTKYSVGVSSATHALHLSMHSLGIQPGDEVIVPTMTFASTADAVKYCGGIPILADVQLDTMNIDPTEIKRKISRKTKAIIPVHYGGQSCDMDDIINISKNYGLSIVEDCAHALGSKFKKEFCGTFGKTGCFSFYPTKVITTGEGGMISTNDKKIFSKIKLLRSHGMTILPSERESKAQWKYDIVEMGYNYRLDEIRASLGLSQFSRIQHINEMRQNIAKKYSSKLDKIKGIIIPKIKENRNHIFHLYTIKVNKDYHMTRDELFLKLHKKGIGTSVQYYPLHLLSYMKKYKNKKSKFPNANILKDQVLCLPIFPKMTEKQINYVIKSIKN